MTDDAIGNSMRVSRKHDSNTTILLTLILSLHLFCFSFLYKINYRYFSPVSYNYKLIANAE